MNFIMLLVCLIVCQWHTYMLFLYMLVECRVWVVVRSALYSAGSGFDACDWLQMHMTHSFCHRVDKHSISEDTKFSSLINTFCNLQDKLGSLCVWQHLYPRRCCQKQLLKWKCWHHGSVTAAAAWLLLLLYYYCCQYYYCCYDCYYCYDYYYHHHYCYYYYYYHHHHHHHYYYYCCCFYCVTTTTTTTTTNSTITTTVNLVLPVIR